MEEKVFPITQFRGLGNPYMFTGDPSRVRVMTNIRSQFGRLIGRDGYTTLGDDPGDHTIMGLADFKKTDNTVKLLRVEGTVSSAGRARVFNTGTSAWDDKGALDAPTATPFYVDFAMHKDLLWFTFPGSSDLVQWDGSSNVAEVAASPAARFVASFGGYILAGYTPGSLAADGQTVAYDDADNGTTWPGGNLLNLRETPGAIQKMLPLGRQLWCYKTDGASILTFVGTALTVFKAERAPMNVGVLASGSVIAIPGVGHIFLGSDGRLHVNDGSLVQPVLTDLNNTLLEDINLSYASNSRATILPSSNIYTLFYPGSGSTTLDKRLEFNFITGEFSIFDYSLGFNAALYSQYATTLLDPSFTLVTANGDDTYKLDTGYLDGSTAVSRIWESDWFNMNTPGYKTLKFIDVICDQSNVGELQLSVAVDMSPDFKQIRTLGLNATRNSRDVVVRYNLAPTIYGQYFNIRVRMKPSAAGSEIKVKGMLIFYDEHEASIREIEQSQRGKI